MKNILLPIFLIAFLLNSCEKVLDKQPLDSITDAAVWEDKVLVDSYLLQCYVEMTFYFEKGYNVSYAQTLGVSANRDIIHAALEIADEGVLRSVPSSGKSNNITISGGKFEWWGYPTIRKLNIFIEKITASNFDDPYKKQRLAEARFLRAFAYFDMVKRYGGIPLITRSQQLNDSDEELYRTRDKEADVYDFILSELDAIVGILPNTYNSSNLGRPTKYAVLALKSRSAMYAASIASWGTYQLDGVVGIPQNKASYYWQASYDASKQIIESGNFGLYNKFPDDKAKNFRNLFLDENNNEVIFSQIFNGQSGVGSPYDFQEVPVKYHVWAWGQYTSVYLQMIESFDNIDGTSGVIDRAKINSGYSWTMDEMFGKKDPRFKASVYTNGSPWTWKTGPISLDYHYGILTPDGNIITSGSYKGILYAGDAYVSGTPATFGILKYLDETERAVTQERGYTDTDYIIFRLGETYLNYAEAAFELGKESDALSAVNMIRQRAGMPLYSSITRGLIHKERKVELAFEGNRYFDVRRWRTAVNDLTQNFQAIRFILDGNSYVAGSYNVTTAKYKLQILDHIHGTIDPYFVDKHYYLPITTSRTSNNPNLIENPGWQ
jgi:starch-binding outer membrane protein, SusD/RagB family